MNVGQQSMRQLASRSGLLKDSVCRTCRNHNARRAYATPAAASATSPGAESRLSSIPPVSQASSPAKAYQIRAGVVLSRPPRITRDLHPFEKAFYLYQKRLNERLALPFTRYFYFKKDSPDGVEWKRKLKTRLTPARDIGVYNAYGDEGWNDEVLVGAKESEPDHILEALLKDAEPPVIGAEQGGVPSKSEAIEKPPPRVTEADKKGDVKSLDRLLQNSLYLLVQNQDGLWTFPSDRLNSSEGLHHAAERVLVEAGGPNMNTWVVGNHPVGYHERSFSESITIPKKNIEEIGQKTFFMKARIMAGQVNLSGNKYGLKDFRWLSKDEIERVVTRPYWSSIRNMLADR